MVKLSLDVGNGYTVVTNGRDIESIPSVYVPLTGGERPRRSQGKIYIGGDLYHVGVGATEYGAHNSIAESSKLELYLPLALVAINQEDEEESYEINLSVPDSARYGEQARELLEGIHTYTLDGEKKRTSININAVVEEGYGSYAVAQLRGKIPSEGYTLVLDIGAGTNCGLLVNNRTQAVVDTFAKEKGGVIGLASMVAKDTRLALLLGDAPSVSVILEGIARGGSAIYYGDSDIDITPYVKSYMKAWFPPILNQARTKYQGYFSNRSIKKILLTGGGSLLVRQRVQKDTTGIMEVAEYPLTDNAMGAFYVE